eukprot:1158517-Pelagomonas_calceolata.AAC.2
MLQPQPPPAHLPQVVVPVQLLAMVVEIQAVAGMAEAVCQRSCREHRPCARSRGPAHLTSWPAMYFRVLTCNRPVLKSKSIQKVRTGFPTNKPRKERSTFALMLCLQSNDPSSGKGKPA